VRRSKKLDSIPIAFSIIALLISSINLFSINRISAEQAARTKKVYQVDPIENRITQLERDSALANEKLKKRSDWMYEMQSDAFQTSSDRMTHTEFLHFILQLEKLNPELSLPEITPVSKVPFHSLPSANRN